MATLSSPASNDFSSGTRRSINMVKEAVAPRPLPVHEMLHLNPIEKFLRYRIVPVKLILNLAILALLLSYVFLYQVPRNSFEANSRFGLASLFFGVNDNTDNSLTVQISDIDTFLTFVSGAVTGYYTVPEESSGVFMHYVYGPFNTTPIAPLLTLRYKGDTFETVERRFNLTQDNPIGPFANVTSLVSTVAEDCYPRRDSGGNAYIPCRNNTIADFFDRLMSADISCRIRGIRIDPGATAATIAMWTINFSFELSAHNSLITVTAQFDSIETHRAETLPVVLCLVLVPLCLWDFILRLRFFHRYHIYVASYLPSWLMPGSRREADPEREKREMRRAGRGWTYFAMLTDVLVIIFCILSFVEAFSFYSNLNVRVATTLFLGFSTMFSCLMLISYLQTAPRFYVLMKALSTALPHLGLYLIGVMPIFAGFAICGTAVFGGFTVTFETFPNSMITLFCALNGDSLLELFTIIDQTDFPLLRLFSRLFFASFLGLFICNVLNIALSIVQDSFTHVKEVYEVCQFDHEETEKQLSREHDTEAKRAQLQGTSARPLRKAELRAMISRIQNALPGSGSVN